MSTKLAQIILGCKGVKFLLYEGLLPSSVGDNIKY